MDLGIRERASRTRVDFDYACLYYCIYCLQYAVTSETTIRTTQISQRVTSLAISDIGLVTLQESCIKLHVCMNDHSFPLDRHR